MRVAIDAQLAVGTATGIGEYVHGLVAALRAQGVDVDELSEPRVDPWRFDRRVFWDQVLLPQRVRNSSADVLHCASGTMPLSVALPVVVTVHDVAWLRVQTHTRPYARYYFGRFSMERYKRAAAVAVDSEFSRAELFDVLPEIDEARVRVVYPGVASDFCGLAGRANDGRTILVVGTVERRKNVAAVIEALPALPNARIVSVGPFTPYQTECEALAASLGVADRVEFRGYVPRSELLELYASCAIVAMPSTYEGFGYAAAQALCAGVPTIVSDRASLPEIVAGDAPSVALDDREAWARELERGLRGEADALAERVRARAIDRFAWAKSAADMVATYELALDSTVAAHKETG